MKYQFGFDLHFRILWIPVSVERFANKVASLILKPGQRATIGNMEILPMFTYGFVLRDGRRLYRAVPFFEGGENV